MATAWAATAEKLIPAEDWHWGRHSGLIVITIHFMQRRSSKLLIDVLTNAGIKNH